jgi:hypothetical protein
MKTGVARARCSNANAFSVVSAALEIDHRRIALDVNRVDQKVLTK